MKDLTDSLMAKLLEGYKDGKPELGINIITTGNIGSEQGGADLTDEAILERLLALNRERARACSVGS